MITGKIIIRQKIGELILGYYLNNNIIIFDPENRNSKEIFSEEKLIQMILKSGGDNEKTT